MNVELRVNNKYSVPNRIDSVNHTSIGHAQTSSYLPDFLCFGASLSANESEGIPLGVALMEIATVDFETSGCVTSLSSANSTFASVVSKFIGDGESIWDKGSFDSPEESLVYHYYNHKDEVGAENLQQYLRKAKAFRKNLKGAYHERKNGKIRYIKKDTFGPPRYIDINPYNGKILSFGSRWD